MTATPLRRRWDAPALMVTALVMAGLLAGCGGRSVSSSTAAQRASSPPSAPGAAHRGVAKPGAQYTVGQTATVGYVPSGSLSNTPLTTLEITVKAIQRGTLADFKDVQLDAQQRAGTPDYVTLKIVNTGSEPADGDTVTASIQGVDNTGSLNDDLSIIGDFPRCNDTSTGATIAPGKSLSTCLIFMVPGGISKVAYIGTEAYINSPLTWK
jgi:hypothetical protein